MSLSAPASPHPQAPSYDLSRELLPFLAYTAAYFSYLCLSLENEFGHWVSLVLLPVALVFLLRRQQRGSATASEVLASVGLRKESLTAGLGWALLLGTALCALQLVFSRDRAEMLQTLISARGLYLLPLAFSLMLLTAGFTEEFFFRGVLQTRLIARSGSKVVGVLVSSFLFGLYHLPYAYLHPRWPSHGDWAAAIGAAFGQGVPMGLILGTLYVKSRSNLLACVLVHTMTNLLPAVVLLARRM